MSTAGGVPGGPGDSSLDSLARELASGRLSRRGALARLGGAALTAAVPSFLLSEAALAACPEKRKCGKKCCPKGARCKHGKCKCRGGKKKCGRKCVDLKTSHEHCGSCSNACAADQTCVEGQCVGGGTQTPTQTCGNGVAEGTEQCDGADLRGATCASLGFAGGTLDCRASCTYDTSACGPPVECSVPDDCPAPAECMDSTCENGLCATAPSAAGTLCSTGVCDGSGSCAACVTDGDCSLPNATATCAGGTCQVAMCDFGFDNCDPNQPGCETNVFDDPSNCGTCGNVCPDTEECLVGGCSGGI